MNGSLAVIWSETSIEIDDRAAPDMVAAKPRNRLLYEQLSKAQQFLDTVGARFRHDSAHAEEL